MTEAHNLEPTTPVLSLYEGLNGGVALTVDGKILTVDG